MSIKSQIESILFVSTKPLSIKQLENITHSNKHDIEQSLDDLINQYNKKGKGINLINNNDKYQFVTSPENAELITEMQKAEMDTDLTRPSLETLTVIVYRGPITRPELEQIRGVNCSLILRNLLMRGLIESQYDKNKVTTFYNITIDFMKFLGIADVKDLPDFEKLNNDERLLRLLKENQE